MRRWHYLATFFICINAFASHAQQPQFPEFGKVDLAELRMKECSFEKDAAAMILVDEEKAEIQVNNYSGDVRVEYTRRVRTKIFNEKGYETASIVIPYYGNNSTTRITNIDATIYNLGADGKIDTYNLDKDEIFKDKGGGKKGVNSVRFTFPRLKPGSVIEYRFTKIRKNSSHIEPWYFQAEIPTQFSSCTIKAPLHSVARVHFVNTQKVNEDSAAEELVEDKMMLRRYFMTNIPSFRVEPLMSSIKDNLQRVEFSISPARGYSLTVSFDASTMWSIYNQGLLISPFFGGQYKKSIDGTQNTLDSIMRMHTDAAKINAVYEYVKRNVQWNKEQTYYAEDINEAWKNKTGNSAEINFLIIDFLRRTGVYCFPLLVSTRENGTVDMTFPGMGQFNGVDVFVKDSAKNYILDGTQRYQSYQVPPFNILNRYAFVIDAKESKWVKVSDSRQLMNSFVSAKGDIDSSGVLYGEAVLIFKDYAKAERLKEDNDDEETKQEKDKDFLNDDQPDLKIDSIEKQDQDDILKPLTHKLKFHYTLSNTGDIYFINPFFLSMFRKNPFTDSVRHTDVDFGCNQYYANSIYITMPEIFSVEEIPKSITIRTADSSIMFKREIFIAENGVIIRNDFELNYPLFTKEEYPELKSFFEKVYALTNQQIVLKKKE